ncbi:SapC family protein [Croceibacterium sp. LX-88]|uniref:SapC family protein n=1 Tax=Croceibacterium selenioxidans TaxID=2838833 RepID=A0ABS5W550_9SPHN|nr:SapC family protein [Croceibacterium selenioxidans]MBT2134452.1 SapC family protein [Croceibacterium selenioxidans]
MSTSVRLDNVEHAALRLRRGHGSHFGEAVNQVAVFASEFQEVQREYPILFARLQEGQVQPVAILGFDREENLFLDGTRWDAAYIPALYRRGPFQVGFSEGEAVINVDLSHPRIAAEGEDGDPVFKPHGGDAPALNAALSALRTLSAGAAAAETMASLFTELGLIEEVKLEVRLNAHSTIDFDGYLAVTAEKIAALDGESLARLNAAGLLDVAIFAASSLGTMQRLIARKQRKLAVTA